MPLSILWVSVLYPYESIGYDNVYYVTTGFKLLLSYRDINKSFFKW